MTALSSHNFPGIINVFRVLLYLLWNSVCRQKFLLEFGASFTVLTSLKCWWFLVTCSTLLVKFPVC